MKQLITLPVKPISVNSMYYGNKRHGLTADTKEWQQHCFHAISKYDLSSLRNTFDPKKHAYKLDIIFYIPKHVYFNKQGLISSKTVDLSNAEKSLLDVLMLPKHYGSNVPYECLNLDADDKYVTEMSSKKMPTLKDWHITIEIEIIDLPIVVDCP